MRDILEHREFPGINRGWKPTVFEEVHRRPVLIENPAQLQEICRLKGLRSAAVENDTIRSRGKGAALSKTKALIERIQREDANVRRRRKRLTGRD